VTQERIAAIARSLISCLGCESRLIQIEHCAWRSSRVVGEAYPDCDHRDTLAVDGPSAHSTGLAAEPGVFLNSAGDVELLPRVLAAAERFALRPGEGQMARLASEQRLSTLFV
jgi:hypothetical protein